MNRIAKPMLIRILMIVNSFILSLVSYLIIYILTGLRNVTNLESLNPFYSFFLKVPVVMMGIIVLSAIICILGFYRFMKVKQDTYSLTNSLAALFDIVLLVLSYSFLQKVQKITSSDDIYSLKDMFNTQSSLIFRVLFVFSIVMIIYNVFILLLAKKIIRINVFIPDHIANSRDVRIGGRVLKSHYGDETRMYMNAPKEHFLQSANGILILILGLSLIIVTMGYAAYSRFILCDPVDLGKYVTLSPNFSVNSGQGKILSTQIGNKLVFKGKSKAANQYLKNLITDTDNYQISKTSHIKNGDVITVKVKYDRQRCDDLHIRVVNNIKKFKLEGFIHEYKNGAEVAKNPTTDKLIKTQANQLIRSQLTGSTVYYDSTWLCKYKKAPDYIVVLYRVSDQQGTHYVSVFSNQNINSNYDSETHVYEGPQKLMNNKTNEDISESSEAHKYMKNGIIISSIDQTSDTSLIEG